MAEVPQNSSLLYNTLIKALQGPLTSYEGDAFYIHGTLPDGTGFRVSDYLSDLFESRPKYRDRAKREELLAQGIAWMSVDTEPEDPGKPGYNVLRPADISPSANSFVLNSIRTILAGQDFAPEQAIVCQFDPIFIVPDPFKDPFLLAVYNELR